MIETLRPFGVLQVYRSITVPPLASREWGGKHSTRATTGAKRVGGARFPCRPARTGQGLRASARNRAGPGRDRPGTAGPSGGPLCPRPLIALAMADAAPMWLPAPSARAAAARLYAPRTGVA